MEPARRPITALRSPIYAQGASGPNGDLRRHAIDVDASGTIEFSIIIDDQPEARSTGAFTTDGTTFTLVGTCPSTDPSPFDSYSVVGDDLKLYITGGNTELVWTRAP